MKQAEQKAVLAEFRQGAFNTLVATCIGEEGLDIPEVSVHGVLLGRSLGPAPLPGASLTSALRGPGGPVPLTPKLALPLPEAARRSALGRGTCALPPLP